MNRATTTSMPATALLKVNVASPLPSVTSLPVSPALGPERTSKSTSRPATGLPVSSWTSAVTVWSVLSGFVASVGVRRMPSPMMAAVPLMMNAAMKMLSSFDGFRVLTRIWVSPVSMSGSIV